MALGAKASSRNAGASNVHSLRMVQRLRTLAATAPAQRLDYARELAEELLIHFGLDSWSFAFMSRRATSRFGDCIHAKKLIRLSPILTEMNEFEEVEDTIRHEIAHALCGPGGGHNAAFYTMCLKVGARPERCYGSGVNRPQRKRRFAKYRRRCIGCTKSWRYRGHLSAVRACGECGMDLINERLGQNGWETTSRWTARCALYSFDMLEHEDADEDELHFGIVAKDAHHKPRRCDYCGSHDHDWEWVRYES